MADDRWNGLPTEPLSAAAPLADDAPPDVAERYVLAEELGRGGAGVVHAAWDRALDRRVALKLLRRGGGQMGRLLREAQALARLRHPNVVTVYDVGRDGDRLFVAMELVEGQSLHAWLHERTPGWRQLLPLFVAAGRGLAAAHAQGLIHRDFKPDNVLVGRDGAVRVADFGLARLASEIIEQCGPVPASPLAVSLTATGGVVGTPRYMSPEQHEGAAVDARADQFAFCVALWEALCGQAPFSGDTSEELARSARAGEVRVPAAGAHLPRWLLAAVRRGLAARPDDRWPSMDALLEVLTRDRRRWLRRGAVVAGVAATATLVAVLAARRAPPPPCAATGSELAGAWDPGVAAAVRASFLASGRPYAADTFDRVARRLDAYAGAWRGMRREACEATAVRHEQSEALLDLRMGCLDHRRGELAALTRLFADQATPSVVDNAVLATTRLTGLDACADRAALEATYPPPADPERRASLAALRPRVAAAKALLGAGQFRAAAAAAAPVADGARALGYPPIEADAARVRAIALVYLKDKGAEAACDRAIDAAGRAKNARLLARGLVTLAALLSLDRARSAETEVVARSAAAALAAVGGDPELEAALMLDRSRNPRLDPGERVARVEQAVALLRGVRPASDFQLAGAITALAVAYRAAHRRDDARRCADEALAIYRQLFGDRHPYVAGAMINLANLLYDQGALADARRELEEALAIQLASLGEEAADTATTLNNLAELDEQLGDLDAAGAEIARALRVREKLLGADSLPVASSLEVAGAIAARRGRSELALASYRRGLAIVSAKLGDRSPKVAELRVNVAGALLDARQPAAALAALDAAQPAIDALGPRAAEMALIARVTRGGAELELGHPARALDLLAPAPALAERAGLPDEERAAACFGAGRALAAAGRDRARAVALAQEARTLAAHDARLRQEIDAWLAGRPRVRAGKGLPSR